MSDDDSLMTTLTKSEIERARNGKPPKPRPCEICGNPLSSTQTRACTPQCRAKLASLSRRTRHDKRGAPEVRSAPRKRKAPVSGARERAGDSLDWLDKLPADVQRIECMHNGWRMEITRA
jgi:hypothetical protein